MVDFKDPLVLARSSAAFIHLTTALLGLYGWEYLLTLRVELYLLTGRWSFKWPYIPYLLARYTLLCNLISLAIASSSSLHMNCFVAYKILSVIGCGAVALASLNVSIRTMVIWRQSTWAMFLLAAMHLAHWCIGITISVKDVNASWDSSSSMCVVNTSGPVGLVVFYSYTLIYDSTILVMTAYGLYKGCRRDALYATVYAQGLWYLVLSLTANIPALVLACLNLNPVINIIFSLPAETISVIASCRFVSSLLAAGETRDTTGGTQECGGGIPPLPSPWSGKRDSSELTTHITLAA